ncbi:MAG: hypothetical protein ACRDP6_42170 [Actinoallomurus sp.]
MSVIIQGTQLQAIEYGTRVDRAASALPQTAQTAYFTVTGGRVLIAAMLGEVTTVVQGQATTVQLIATPTTGTAVNLSNSTGDVNAKEVGATVALASTLGGTLVVNNAGATVLPLVNAFVVRTGTIDLKTAASSTGATKWSLWYVPLDASASVAAA